MPLITILTPTYNRASLLPRLYESLCRQTCKDFEWIVVDDGSTDDTEQRIASFVGHDFPMHYYQKSNGGKHTAVNFGVKKAQGVLALILDSDDELPITAVNDISIAWKNANKNSGSRTGKGYKPMGGVCGYMMHRNGQIIGKPLINACCDELLLRYHHHVKGDMCEVFLTKVLREYPFPEFVNEKFCPEALIWNRIAQRYSLSIFSRVIYIRDYLDGGLTDNIVRVRMHSPIASMMTYAEMLKYNIPVKEKVKAAINYWRFRFCLQTKDADMPKISLPWVLTMPLGWLMHVNDKRAMK